MADSQQQSQQQQPSQQPQLQQQQQQQQQNNPVQQQAVRGMSQQSQQTGSPAVQHATGNQPTGQQQQQHGQQQAIQPQPIQPQQQQQNIQPQPQQQQQQQNLHHQQHQQQLQQQAIQPQQIQSLPQLQIAPQQQQHVMPNLHTMTSVPLSMAMSGNPMTANLTGGNLRPQLGQLQQVQVIQQSPTYMPAQFAYNPQQQLMLQNMQAAMHMSMNPQQLNMANMVAMQNRPNTGMFTPGAMSMSQAPSTPTSGTFVTISSAPVSQPVSTTTSTGTVQGKSSNSKQQSQQQQQQQQNQHQQHQQQQQQQQLHTLGQVQQAQATAMIGGKPIILGQAGSLLQGQIGVISAGQLQTTQAYATGQTFGQLQSKPGQQINLSASGGQGQIQLNGSQGGIRFSQGQLVSNGGNAQLITSQPVFTNQMIQAMSQLQHFQPQTPIMLTQGQAPTLSSGQKLYINPVQTQNLMTGVATMNTAFKSPTPQTVQNVALPIQKQTTAAQTGKVLLPSMSKTLPSTAKVPPNSVSGGAAKSPGQILNKNKGRPKGSGKSSPAISSSANQGKPDSSPGQSKPATPTVGGSPDQKRESDSELEGPRKSTNEDPLSGTQRPYEKDPVGMARIEKLSDKPLSTPDYRPSIIASDQPVERQRAIVKPHILTHVIEGFVIQEGPEPFPVQRSSLLTEFIPPKPGQPVEQSSLISMEDEELEQEGETSHEESGPMSGPLQCEICNTIFSSLNPTQRFCSKSCAKRYNVGCTKRLQHFPGNPKDSGRALKRKRKGKKSWGGSRHTSSGSMAGPDIEDQSSSVSQEDTPSPSTTPDLQVTTPPPDLQRPGNSEYAPPNTSPRKWNVQEVYEFIRNLQGCSMYAEEFRSQEIDGQALLLLKEDHLMTTMNMKLGPALKICARINTIKEETS